MAAKYLLGAAEHKCAPHSLNIIVFEITLQNQCVVVFFLLCPIFALFYLVYGMIYKRNTLGFVVVTLQNVKKFTGNVKKQL